MHSRTGSNSVRIGFPDDTQVHLARALGVKQETVSRLEKPSDMLLSTLRG
jgi:hypothetical protein